MATFTIYLLRETVTTAGWKRQHAEALALLSAFREREPGSVERVYLDRLSDTGRKLLMLGWSSLARELLGQGDPPGWPVTVRRRKQCDRASYFRGRPGRGTKLAKREAKDREWNASMGNRRGG